MKVCLEKDCQENVYARGLCRPHYRSAPVLPPKAPPKPNDRKCESLGCERPHHAKGLCATHYKKRWLIRVARSGHLALVSADPVREQARDLQKKLGWSQARIARELGVGQQGFNYALTHPMTHRELVLAMDRLWWDYCGPVEKDTRRYPVEPLERYLVRRFGGLKQVSSAAARQMSTFRRTGLSNRQADELATRYGLIANELWDDFGETIEEAS